MGKVGKGGVWMEVFMNGKRRVERHGEVVSGTLCSSCFGGCTLVCVKLRERKMDPSPGPAPKI